MDNLIPAIIDNEALRMMSPAVLAKKLGVPEAVVVNVLANPETRLLVARKRVELTQTGELFRTRAKAMATDLLDDVVNIATDPDIDPGTRLRAVQIAVKCAGLEPQEGPQTAVQVNIGFREALAAGESRVQAAVTQEGAGCRTQ